MPTTAHFDTNVSTRTRVATEIKNNPELLAEYKEAGGIESELDEVEEKGKLAERLNAAQSAAAASGKHSTLDIGAAWIGIQGEYSAVMGILQAIVGQMERSGRTGEVFTQLQAILKNEVQTTIADVVVTKTGETKKKARRVESVEATRLEISKDASALVKLTAVHESFHQRGVTLDRLKKLRDDADGLAGKLSARAVKKGAAKNATKAEKDAVLAQRAVWGSIYRVLQKAAAKNQAIRNLLTEAAR